MIWKWGSFDVSTEELDCLVLYLLTAKLSSALVLFFATLRNTFLGYLLRNSVFSCLFDFYFPGRCHLKQTLVFRFPQNVWKHSFTLSPCLLFSVWGCKAEWNLVLQYVTVQLLTSLTLFLSQGNFSNSVGLSLLWYIKHDLFAGYILSCFCAWADKHQQGSLS